MSAPQTPTNESRDKELGTSSTGKSKGKSRKVIEFSLSSSQCHTQREHNIIQNSASENFVKNQAEIDAKLKQCSQQDTPHEIQPEREHLKAASVTQKPRKSIQYSPVPPPPSVDEAMLKKRAAEARAYALSGTSKKKAKTLPMKASHSYGCYPTYGAPAGSAGLDSRSRHLANNPQHRPPSSHPYHHPPPPHYYYEYPPPPPSHQHSHQHPPHPPYPYYHAPHPYSYNYPPLPPPIAPGPSSAANSSYPTHVPPYSYPANPVQPVSELRPQSPRQDHKAKPSVSTGPLPATRSASSATSSSPTTTTATPSPIRNSLAHTVSEGEQLPAAHRTSLLLQQSKTEQEDGEDPLITLNPLRFDDEDDDYVKFVRSLGLQDAESVRMAPEDDDEEDFLLTNPDDDDEEEEEEEDDEDDEDDAREHQQKLDSNKPDVIGPDTRGRKWDRTNVNLASAQLHSSPSSPTKKKSAWTLDLPEFDPNFYRELEEELGGLEEEDLEAAVASLLGTTSTSYGHAQKNDVNDVNAPRGENISSLFAAEAKASESEQATAKTEPDGDLGSPYYQDLEPGTPLRNATGMRTKTLVTSQQVERLQALLNRHYQILVQQAVLAIQAAHLAKTHRFRDKTDFLSGETADDLVHVLDAAVGMVQDLDQNRKDAIRNAIQFEDASILDRSRTKRTTKHSSRGEHSQVNEVAVGEEQASSSLSGEVGVPRDQRRLTRAAFSKTLQQHTERKSVFNIKGLHRLQETFHALDRSIGSGSSLYHADVGAESTWYTETCRGMLNQAGADYVEHLLPGTRDLSELFSTPQEYLGEEFQVPCSDEQERFLRRFRTIFTSGEDNLVLRGVNLYGEKQWILIADRYLPDRSINNISQRYSKLCVMLYKAQGIHIDSDGNLETPPKLESVEDIDDEKVALITKAAPPAILNVHRWSLEEDLTLLRGVPLMGHMWAELGARLIPHRDRGHLRKRYQVLERRVKATVTRYLKGHDSVAKVASKMREKEHNQRHQRRRLEEEQARQQQAMQLQDLRYQHRFHQPPGRIPSHLRPFQAQPIPLAPRVTLPPTHTVNVPTTKPAAGPIPNANLPSRSELALASPNINHHIRDPPNTSDQIIKTETPFPPEQQECAETTDFRVSESSQAAVAFLVGDSSRDWSQMSRIKEMMENEVESEIVGTLASRLAKPQNSANNPSKAVAVAKKAPSILTTVLERANQRSGKPSIGLKRKNTLPTTRTSKRLAAVAAAKQTKKEEFPALKSPLLVGFRAGSSSGLVSKNTLPMATACGSPEVNSALFACGSTLDGLKFEDLDATGAVDSIGSSRSKISANDLEAISALNSLSNSPALTLTQRKSCPPSTRSRKGNEEDKSFFAKITGRVKDRDSNRKRKLNF